MPSQKEIAQRLGVHVTLVSKVLSGRMGTSGVSDALADRIRATAREMGYRKNQNAAALRGGRQNVVAAAIDRRMGIAGSGIVESLVAGVSHGAVAHEQRQVMAFFDSIDAFRRIAATLNPGMADGLVLAGLRPDELLDDVRRLRERGLPVVTIFNPDFGDGIPNVRMCDAEIIRLATAHLIERGRRRILHVSCSRPHERGYHDAHRDAGLPVDERLVFYDLQPEVNFTREQGEAAISKIVEGGVSFDAVCAQSDMQALGALHALMRRGIDVPRQVMITGVDNSPLAREAFVALTSVDQQFEQRATMAVDLLDDLVAGKEVASPTVEPRLVVRASTTRAG